MAGGVPQQGATSLGSVSITRDIGLHSAKSEKDIVELPATQKGNLRDRKRKLKGGNMPEARSLIDPEDPTRKWEIVLEGNEVISLKEVKEEQNGL